jgi:hypothetical protein
MGFRIKFNMLGGCKGVSSTMKALEMYRNDLIKIKDKAECKFQKEVDKHNKEIDKILNGYSSINDINDAYGCGSITEKRRSKFIEVFEDADKVRNYQSATGLYIKMLNRDIKDVEIELQMIELELQTGD